MQARLTISFQECLDLFALGDEVTEWCEANGVHRPLWSTPPTLWGTVPTSIDDVMTAVFPDEQQATAFKLRWL